MLTYVFQGKISYKQDYVIKIFTLRILKQK